MPNQPTSSTKAFDEALAMLGENQVNTATGVDSLQKKSHEFQDELLQEKEELPKVEQVT